MKVTLSPEKIKVELLDSAEPREAEVQLPHQISAEFLIKEPCSAVNGVSEQVTQTVETKATGEKLPKPAPWSQDSTDGEASAPEDLTHIATLECPEVTWEEFYEAVNTKPEEWTELFRIIEDQHPELIASAGPLDQ